MRLLIALVVLLHAIALNAGVYKWVDENGRTHYGDKPHDENAELIQLEKNPQADSRQKSRAARQNRLLDVMDEERREGKKEKARVLAEKQKRQANCAKARKNLREIEQASFLYRKTDDPLNPAIYSDEERAEITAKVKKDIMTWCK